MNPQRLAQIDSIRSKIQAHPNSPKVAAWKNEIKKLRSETSMSRNVPKFPDNSNTVTAPLAPPSLGSVPINAPDSKFAPHSGTTLSVANSVASFTYPDTNVYQLCDATTQPTNMLRSCQEYVVNVNFDGTPNAGKFAIATQPSPGSVNDILKFSTGIVDTSSGWPANFYDKSAYVNSSSGLNPRLDNNLLELIGSKQAAWSFARKFTNYTIPPPSLALDGFMFNATQGVQAGGSNPLGSLKVVRSPLPTGTYGGITSMVMDNPVAYTFASGTYNISLSLTISPNSTTADAIRIVALDEANVIIGVLQFETSVTGAPTVATGILSASAGNVNVVVAVDPGTPVSLTTALKNYVSFNLSHNSKVKLVFGAIWQAAVGIVLTDVWTTLQIITVNDPLLPSISDNGLVSTLRPLGHSALLTNLLPEILAGGNIVAYSVPPGDIRNLFYSENSLVTPQEWFQLATLNKGNLMYDGPVKDGCYAFTQPWSENDLLLRTPTEVSNYGYQGIIMSGVVLPPTGYTGVVSAFRLRIITLWEYVTDSPIFTPKSLVGDGEQSGQVLSLLSCMQHATPNNRHISYLNSVMKKTNQILGRQKKSSNLLNDLMGGVGQIAGDMFSFL